ncbi:MAG: hypothetical protein MK138_18640, partial [Planctomycetes bacterium]|nr:hypothetical protein [Planctomycetota bacterium]
MGVAFTVASVGAGYAIWTKQQWKGVAVVAVLIVLALVIRPKAGDAVEDAEAEEVVAEDPPEEPGEES